MALKRQRLEILKRLDLMDFVGRVSTDIVLLMKFQNVLVRDYLLDVVAKLLVLTVKIRVNEAHRSLWLRIMFRCSGEWELQEVVLTIVRAEEDLDVTLLQEQKVGALAEVRHGFGPRRANQVRFVGRDYALVTLEDLAVQEHVAPGAQVSLHEDAVVLLKLVENPAVFQVGKLLRDSRGDLSNDEVLVHKNKEKPFYQRVRLHVSERGNCREDFLDEGSHELRFVLEVLVRLSQLLRKVSVSSLLLKAVFPPNLVDRRRCRNVGQSKDSLLLLDLCKVNHLVIKNLHCLPAESDHRGAHCSLLLESRLKRVLFYFCPQFFAK